MGVTFSSPQLQGAQNARAAPAPFSVSYGFDPSDTIAFGVTATVSNPYYPAHLIPKMTVPASAAGALPSIYTCNVISQELTTGSLLCPVKNIDMYPGTATIAFYTAQDVGSIAEQPSGTYVFLIASTPPSTNTETVSRNGSPTVISTVTATPITVEGACPITTPPTTSSSAPSTTTTFSPSLSLLPISINGSLYTSSLSLPPVSNNGSTSALSPYSYVSGTAPSGASIGYSLSGSGIAQYPKGPVSNSGTSVRGPYMTGQNSYNFPSISGTSPPHSSVQSNFPSGRHGRKTVTVKSTITVCPCTSADLAQSASPTQSQNHNQTGPFVYDRDIGYSGPDYTYSDSAPTAAGILARTRLPVTVPVQSIPAVIVTITATITTLPATCNAPTSNAPTSTTTAICTSAAIPNPNPPTGDRCGLTGARHGESIELGGYPGTSPAECAERCFKTPSCLSFSFEAGDACLLFSSSLTRALLVAGPGRVSYYDREYFLCAGGDGTTSITIADSTSTTAIVPTATTTTSSTCTSIATLKPVAPTGDICGQPGHLTGPVKVLAIGHIDCPGPEACAARCSQNPKCASFSIDSGLSEYTCLLLDGSSSSTFLGFMPNSREVTYYDLSCLTFGTVDTSSTMVTSTTLPGNTLPTTTLPSIDISTTLPSTTFSDTTLPGTTLLSTTLPGTDVSTTLPSTTLPSTTLPGTDTSATLPVPSTTLPSTTPTVCARAIANPNTPAGDICGVSGYAVNPQVLILIPIVQDVNLEPPYAQCAFDCLTDNRCKSSDLETDGVDGRGNVIYSCFLYGNALTDTNFEERGDAGYGINSNVDCYVCAASVPAPMTTEVP